MGAFWIAPYSGSSHLLYAYVLSKGNSYLVMLFTKITGAGGNVCLAGLAEPYGWSTLFVLFLLQGACVSHGCRLLCGHVVLLMNFLVAMFPFA